MDNRMSKTKLNLGCGIIYKPGYINIDKFDSSIADIICDVENLPFKSNSVDLIEAFQLIEHFDYIHCKYILSEWFRVLKPEGILILETPDLEKSFKKFPKANLETKKELLRWIYGTNTLGMEHRTGFTFPLLKVLLKEIGFREMSKDNAKTHVHNPGIRIICKKPRDYLQKQIFACFRKEIKNKLKIRNSYLLIPLEDYIQEICNIYSQEFFVNKEKCLNRIIIKGSIVNPIIPLTFCENLIKFSLIKKSEIRNEIDLMRYLDKVKFHKKFFSLWKGYKKTIGNTDQEFINLLGNLESLLQNILSGKQYCKKKLGNIISLPSSEIKFFDIRIILLKARELFNRGIKYFYKRQFSRALKLFLESIKLNPENSLAYWNIGRLKVILNANKNEIIKNYQKTLLLINNKTKKILKIELNNVFKKRKSKNFFFPVSESYFLK